MAAATNTGAVLLSFDTNERPPVVALPAQVRRHLVADALAAEEQPAGQRSSQRMHLHC